MKFLRSVLIAILAIGSPTVSPASAEDYFYWPEFGTFAQHNDWGYEFVHAPQAHQAGVTGKGIKIAILDDGLAAYAPGLANKVVAYRDFLPGQAKQSEHGTMVASTIASDYDPTVGIGGIAPGASLMVARVCFRGGCEWDAIRNALAWAVEEGADVISMSFTGYPEPYMNSNILSAVKKGIVVVASMGNSGCGPYSAWGISPYCLPTRVTESTQAGYPVAGVIAVGASDHKGGRVATLGWSSSFGPNHDIMAPGIDTSAYDAFGASNGFGGTSSSAPIVAGVAALVLSVKPDLTPAQVQAILQASASTPIEVKGKVWDSCAKDSETQVWSCNQIIDSPFPQQYFTGAGVVDALGAVNLTKRIAAGQVLPEPQTSLSGTTLTFNWAGGPADVWVNSKLYAANASPGITYEGFTNQSVAVQIRRSGQVSAPAIAMVAEKIVPPKPLVSRFRLHYDGGLWFDVENLSTIKDVLWRKYWNWDPNATSEYSGIFTFTDGESAGCKGNPWEDQISFRCPYLRDRTDLSGTFRLIGVNSDLGEQSDFLSFTLQQPVQTIAISSTYSDQGQPSFTWQSVPGAKSYKYRFESDYIFHCTQETQFSPGILPLNAYWLQVWAMAEPDCTGQILGVSENTTYRPLPPKPPKPEGITVKDVSFQHVEFDVPNRGENTSWRIYRSDGLMVRINPGQRFVVGMQAHEDVNNKEFSYRFVQINSSIWSDSWSELSDPVVVRTKSIEKPNAECHIAIRQDLVRCASNGISGTQRTLIEYLDSDMTVLSSVEFNNDWPRPKFFSKPAAGAVYIRIAGTLGDPGTRNSWYRRGESNFVVISQRTSPSAAYQVR